VELVHDVSDLTGGVGCVAHSVQHAVGDVQTTSDAGVARGSGGGRGRGLGGGLTQHILHLLRLHRTYAWNAANRLGRRERRAARGAEDKTEEGEAYDGGLGRHECQGAKKSEHSSTHSGRQRVQAKSQSTQG
jgi:hypothetical protein